MFQKGGQNRGAYPTDFQRGSAPPPASSEFSKPRDSGLDFSNRYAIWQALRQQHCLDACQISERYDQYDIKSRGFEISP